MLQGFEKISGYDRYHKGKENYQKRNVWDKNAKEIDDLFPDLLKLSTVSSPLRFTFLPSVCSHLQPLLQNVSPVQTGQKSVLYSKAQAVHTAWDFSLL